MGTWGPGNFSDDNALDWLGSLVDELVSGIDRSMAHTELICGHALAARVEVLALLCEQLNAVPPKPEVVTVWRAWHMRTWEAQIDSYHPKPEYKAQRRDVLQATFSRLLNVAARWHRREPQDSQDWPPPGRARMQLYVGEGPN